MLRSVTVGTCTALLVRLLEWRANSSTRWNYCKYKIVVNWVARAVSIYTRCRSSSSDTKFNWHVQQKCVHFTKKCVKVFQWNGCREFCGADSHWILSALGNALQTLDVICISIRKIILWSHLPFFAKCKERQVRSDYNFPYWNTYKHLWCATLTDAAVLISTLLGHVWNVILVWRKGNIN